MRGILLALGAATLWGISGNFAQFLFQDRAVDPRWFVTIRLLLAGAGLLAFARARGFALFTIWQAWRRLIAFAILGMLAVQYTYFAAIQHSNAATATVLQYLGPVFIALFYAWSHRRVPRLVEALAIAFALAGTLLLVTHGRLDSLAITPIALFWGLASALALASYSILPVPLLKKWDASVVVGWGMLLGGVTLALFTPPWIVSGTWDTPAYISAAFIIVLGSLVAFYAYLSSVALLGANKASLLACAEPLSAAFVAVIWMHVSFGFYDWLGTLLIIATILILTWSESRTPPKGPDLRSVAEIS